MAIDCYAVRERRALTRAIQRATSPTEVAFAVVPDDGSERSLAISFAVLHGIVKEYLDGGDQLTELCTCGQHTKMDRIRQIVEEDPT